MKDDYYDAIIIGSGLGGLLSGVILIKKGYKPLILEKLSYYGGKFSSFNYKGFEVPTGAFHALPGGYNGNIIKLLDYLNIKIELITASPPFVVMMNKKCYVLTLKPNEIKYIFAKNSFVNVLSLKEKIQLARIVYSIMYSKNKIPDVSLDDFLKKYTESNKILTLINKIINFTNSTDIKNSSAVDIITSLRIQNRNFEGIIKGGCKHLTLKLIKFIEENGGTLLNNIHANKILVENDKAIGVVTENNSYFSNLIISNTGPKQMVNLLNDNCPNWLIEKSIKSIPVFGIAYSISSDKPFSNYKSVFLPLDAEKISGLLPISNFDSNLSQKNKHYLLAYQLFNHDEDINEAIKLGKQELCELFPDIVDENIFNISVYKDDWPATFTQQRLGQTGRQRYPVQIKDIENLYMIGHDSEGIGFAAEIIGDAAFKLNEIIEEKKN